MAEQVFHVPNITCGHCVATIKNELSEIKGVKSVDGDPGTKNVSVVWDSPATKEQILALLKEINYPAD